MKRNSVKSSKLLCLQCSGTFEVWEYSTIERLFIHLFIFRSVLFFFHKGIKNLIHLYKWSYGTVLFYQHNFLLLLLLLLLLLSHLTWVRWLYKKELGLGICGLWIWILDEYEWLDDVCTLGDRCLINSSCLFCFFCLLSLLILFAGLKDSVVAWWS